MAGHEATVERAAASAVGMTASARNALSKMAERLSLPQEPVEPSRFLLALQTYYAIVVKFLTWSIVEPTAGADASPVGLLGRENIERFESGEYSARWGANGFPDTPCWAWYLELWDRPLERWLQSLTQRFSGLAPITSETDPAQGHDLFGTFYMGLLPKQVRHALGEHYTPVWLADHVLDQVGFDRSSRGRLLDPTCGSGVFLLRALARMINPQGGKIDPRQVSRQVVGMDVNSLAVLAARANYLLALRRELDPDCPLTLPVRQGDVVLEEQPEPEFDFLVGNPPWVAWDHLPDDYRRQTKSLWQRYGLFSLSGNVARHGGAKKDLAMLVLYCGADRFLRSGGRLGMVVTQTLFQTRGAGDGFRRFQLGDNGPPLKVLQVDDLVDVQPFDTAANWTATVVFEKGAPTTYPVPYRRWTRQPGQAARSPSPSQPRLACQILEALPVDPQRRQSPWLVRPAGMQVSVDRWTGPSDYTAHLGANTGGANGVYWFRLLGREGPHVAVENLPGRGKQVLPIVRALLEPDLLYPLVCWGDVRRFQAVPSAYLLLVQDTVTRRGIDQSRLERDFPQTYAYLKQFEPLLRRRAAYRRYQDSAPFYSMYNVGEYTLSPYKVIWRRMDRLLRAAVLASIDVPLVGARPIVCQETCVMIATQSADEAHYLAALLNSSVVGFLVQAHNVRGGKGFGSPGMLEHLGIRRFDRCSEDHRELARLGLAAHSAAVRGDDFCDIGQEIDKMAAAVYQIEPAEARRLADLVEKPGEVRGRETGSRAILHKLD